MTEQRSERIREVVNSTVTPILLALVGFFGVQTMHEINASLMNLQSGQAAANERLAKIETKIQTSEGASTELSGTIRRVDDHVEALDRRLSVIEASRRK